MILQLFSFTSVNHSRTTTSMRKTVASTLKQSRPPPHKSPLRFACDSITGIEFTLGLSTFPFGRDYSVSVNLDSVDPFVVYHANQITCSLQMT